MTQDTDKYPTPTPISSLDCDERQREESDGQGIEMHINLVVDDQTNIYMMLPYITTTLNKL